MDNISSIKQQGFTLIELMITLLLGALISAAVIQVFVTSQRVDRLQSSGSEIQDKSIFGMQSLEKQIRKANLGNDEFEIDSLTPTGGIVMTAISQDAANDDELTDDERKANVITETAIETGYITRSDDMDTAGTNAWTGVSAMLDNVSGESMPSDQLTIQYTNVVDGMPMFDCEGTQIDQDDRVIERYFLEEDDKNNINLHCDAGRIEPKAGGSEDLVVNNFGASSDGNSNAVIIENVDQFNIRLGAVRRTVKQRQPVLEKADMTVKEYMAITTDRPSITNIRISVLARSTSNSPEGSPDVYTIFGQQQKLKEANNKYMRRLYETNILLRNARVLDL